MGRRGNATTPAKNALAADSAESVDAMQLGPAAEQTEPCPYCDTCKNLTGETVNCSSCEDGLDTFLVAPELPEPLLDDENADQNDDDNADDKNADDNEKPPRAVDFHPHGLHHESPLHDGVPCCNGNNVQALPARGRQRSNVVWTRH